MPRKKRISCTQAAAGKGLSPGVLCPPSPRDLNCVSQPSSETCLHHCPHTKKARVRKKTDLGLHKCNGSLTSDDIERIVDIAEPLSLQAHEVACSNSEFHQPAKDSLDSCKNSPNAGCYTKGAQTGRKILLRKCKNRLLQGNWTDTMFQCDFKIKSQNMSDSRGSKSKKRLAKHLCNENEDATDDDFLLSKYQARKIISESTGSTSTKHQQPVNSVPISISSCVSVTSNSPESVNSVNSANVDFDHALKPTVGVSPTKKGSRRVSKKNSEKAFSLPSCETIAVSSTSNMGSSAKEQQQEHFIKTECLSSSSTKICRKNQKSRSTFKVNSEQQAIADSAIYALSPSGTDSDGVMHSESLSVFRKNGVLAPKKNLPQKLLFSDNFEKNCQSSCKMDIHAIQQQNDLTCNAVNKSTCVSSNSKNVSSQQLIATESAVNLHSKVDQQLDAISVTDKLKSADIAYDRLDKSTVSGSSVKKNEINKKSVLKSSGKKRLGSALRSRHISACQNQQQLCTVIEDDASRNTLTYEAVSQSESVSKLDVDSHTEFLHNLKTSELREKEEAKDLIRKSTAKKTKVTSHGKSAKTEESKTLTFHASKKSSSKAGGSNLRTKKAPKEHTLNDKTAVSDCLPHSIKMGVNNSELMSELAQHSQLELVEKPILGNLESTYFSSKTAKNASGMLLSMKNYASSVKTSHKQNSYFEKGSLKSDTKHNSDNKKDKKESSLSSDKNTSHITASLCDSVDNKLLKSLDVKCGNVSMISKSKGTSVVANSLPNLHTEKPDVAVATQSAGISFAGQNLKKISEVITNSASKISLNQKSKDKKMSSLKLPNKNCKYQQGASISCNLSKDPIKGFSKLPLPAACAAKLWREVDFLPPLSELPKRKKVQKKQKCSHVGSELICKTALPKTHKKNSDENAKELEICSVSNIVESGQSEVHSIQATGCEISQISNNATQAVECSSNVFNKENGSEVSEHSPLKKFCDETLTNQAFPQELCLSVASTIDNKQTCKRLFNSKLATELKVCCNMTNIICSKTSFAKDEKLRLQCMVLLSKLKPSIAEQFFKLRSSTDSTKMETAVFSNENNVDESQYCLEESQKVEESHCASLDYTSIAEVGDCLDRNKKRKGSSSSLFTSQEGQKKRKISAELANDVILSTISMSLSSGNDLLMTAPLELEDSDKMDSINHNVESNNSNTSDICSLKLSKVKNVSPMLTSGVFSDDADICLKKVSSYSLTEKRNISGKKQKLMDEYNKQKCLKHDSEKTAMFFGSEESETENDVVQGDGIVRINVGSSPSKVVSPTEAAVLHGKNLSEGSIVSDQSSCSSKKVRLIRVKYSHSHTIAKSLRLSNKKKLIQDQGVGHSEVVENHELKNAEGIVRVNETSVKCRVNNLCSQLSEQSRNCQAESQENALQSLESLTTLSPTNDQSSDILSLLDNGNFSEWNETRVTHASVSSEKDSALVPTDKAMQDQLSADAFGSCLNESSSEFSKEHCGKVTTELSQRIQCSEEQHCLEKNELPVGSNLIHLENGCIVLDCVDDVIGDLVPDTAPSVQKHTDGPSGIHFSHPMFSETSIDPFGLESNLKSTEQEHIPGLDLLQEDNCTPPIRTSCLALLNVKSKEFKSRVHFDFKLPENVDKRLKMKAAWFDDVIDTVSIQAHKSVPMDEASVDEQSDDEIWQSGPALRQEESCDLQEFNVVPSESVVGVQYHTPSESGNIKKQELQPLQFEDTSNLKNELPCERLISDSDMIEEQEDAISLLAPSLGHDSVLATSNDAIEVPCSKKPVRKIIPIVYMDAEDGLQDPFSSTNNNQRERRMLITAPNKVLALTRSDHGISRFQGEQLKNGPVFSDGLSIYEQTEVDDSDNEEYGASVENMNDMKTSDLMNAFSQALLKDNLPSAVVIFENLVPKLIGIKRYEMLEALFKKAVTRNQRMGKNLVRKLVKLVLKVIPVSSETLQKKVRLLRSCFNAIRSYISYPAHLELSSAISQGGPSLTHLYNNILLNSINSNIAEVLHLYQAGRHIGIVLDSVTARALLVMFHLASVPHIAHELFQICCWMGVYPTIKVNEWPNCLRLRSYYTEAEISMLFNSYLHKLAIHFSRTAFFKDRILTTDEKYKSYIHIEVVECPEGINVRYLRDVDFSYDAASYRIRNVLFGYGIHNLGLNDNQMLHIPSDEIQKVLSSKVKYGQIAYRLKAPQWSHGPFKKAFSQTAVIWDSNPFHNGK